MTKECVECARNTTPPPEQAMSQRCEKKKKKQRSMNSNNAEKIKKSPNMSPAATARVMAMMW